MNPTPIIKVCGMRQADNIRRVEAAGVNWMGFIFYPKSPRYINLPPDYLPVNAKRVGVFVNETPQKIAECSERFSLNYIQLHGNERPETCHALRKHTPVIKAFSVERPDDLKQTAHYEGSCDYFLFDTKCTRHGGSGRQFDWSILTHYQGLTPFLLSGGIAPESASALKQLQHPGLAGYDINSRFETMPGVKDAARIKEFITQLNNPKNI